MASFAAGAVPMALQFRNLSFSSSHLTPPRSQILETPLSTPPLISLSSSPQTIPSIYCGRGDRKTAKGKRFNHSFGNVLGNWQYNLGDEGKLEQQIEMLVQKEGRKGDSTGDIKKSQKRIHKQYRLLIPNNMVCVWQRHLYRRSKN